MEWLEEEDVYVLKFHRSIGRTDSMNSSIKKSADESELITPMSSVASVKDNQH